jgi:hypothetical protein
MSYCYNNGVYVAEPKSSVRPGAAARRRTATAAQRRGRRPASSAGVEMSLLLTTCPCRQSQNPSGS